jgi:hypothetical protein
MLQSKTPPTAQRRAEKRAEPHPFSGNFEITVVFTTARTTLRAMKTAGRLAAGLGATLRIIVPRVVPDIARRQFHTENGVHLPYLRTIAGNERINTRIDVQCCQDRWQMLERELHPGSIVIVGGSSRWWWPTPESRLVEKLRAAGHAVLFCQK